MSKMKKYVGSPGYAPTIAGGIHLEHGTLLPAELVPDNDDRWVDDDTASGKGRKAEAGGGDDS